MRLAEFFRLFKNNSAQSSFLKYYFGFLAMAFLFALVVLVPYSILWIYGDGDLALERAVKRQAKGEFVIFGSGISQNFIEYKLELYKNIRPEICVTGSSRTMQFRGDWFKTPFVNMGGVAGNLAELRFSLEEMLKIHSPKGIIIGLDFWWFMPQWEKEPLKPLAWKQGSYAYNIQAIKKPWQWLADGKVSLNDLLKPLLASFGSGFNPNRFGIMAQKYNEGFGPDGSWYNTAELTGKKPPFDYQFNDTLEQIEAGIKAFYHADKNQNNPSPVHLRALREILSFLKDRNIKYWLFIPPLSQKAFNEMEKNKDFWPHLFNLRSSLEMTGISVPDFSSPASFNSSDCEFIDGFHGGEIAYARILSELAIRYPELEKYINISRLTRLIQDWKNHAMSFNPKVTLDPEIDFNNFGCPKKTVFSSEHR